MRSNDEIQAVNQVVQRLSARFAAFEVDEIANVVRECHARFTGNPIRDFVPLLVEHAARDQLRAKMPLRTEESPADAHEPAPARSGMLRGAFGDGKSWAIL